MTTQTWTYPSGGGGYREKGCTHSGVKQVFEIGKAKVFAGSRQEVERETGWALIINLLGYSTSNATPAARANKEAQAILPPSLYTFAPTPVLAVEWGDGSVPNLPAEWWSVLLEALKEIDGDVAVHCQGGHGRTGTFLAILAAKLGYRKQGCPVLWVRKHYCKQAVETSSQLDYVENMTGVKVRALSSYALAAAEREAKAKAEQTTLPLPAPEGQPTSSGAKETTSQNGGLASSDDEWVWDRESHGLVRKSELAKRGTPEEWEGYAAQDWDGSWHGKM